MHTFYNLLLIGEPSTSFVQRVETAQIMFRFVFWQRHLRLLSGIPSWMRFSNTPKPVSAPLGACQTQYFVIRLRPAARALVSTLHALPNVPSRAQHPIHRPCSVRACFRWTQSWTRSACHRFVGVPKELDLRLFPLAESLVLSHHVVDAVLQRTKLLLAAPRFRLTSSGFATRRALALQSLHRVRNENEIRKCIRHIE
jgi:hypothetical protein